MAKKYFTKTSISSALSTILLGASSLGMVSNANANAIIMGQAIGAGATSVKTCQSCHTGLAGSESKTALKSGYSAAYTNGGIPGLVTLIASLQPARPMAKENTVNTAPVINSVAAEWTTGVTKELTIPLVVNDAQGDNFVIEAVDASVYKPKHLTNVLPGAVAYSTAYLTKSGLPAIDLKWTPNADALLVTPTGQDFVLKIVAKEDTLRVKKLVSKPILVKVHVLPEFTTDENLSKLMVSSVNWSAGNLTVKGKVVISNPPTDYFITPSPEITIIGNNTAGIELFTSPQTITFAVDGSGDWSTDPLLYTPLATDIPCSVKVTFRGETAIHAIAGAPAKCAK
jgi:hypothetical protein